MATSVNQLKLDESQYRVIVESAPNMIWRSGVDALYDYFNKSWFNFTGRTVDQEIGDGWADGVHPDDLERCMGIYRDSFNKRVPFEMVYRLRRRDGEYRWIHNRGVPFVDDAGRFGGYVGSCIDVTEQVTGESWKSLAQIDGLTGVWNRYFFDQQARQLFNMAMRYKKKLSAVMFDVDSFKYFNDHYGHQFGDKILIFFTDVLKATIRETDLLGRYGGDEFILFLPETGLVEAETLIGRISDKIEYPLSFSENSRIFMSFSHGAVQINDDETFESFIERADQAMYERKRKKKQPPGREDDEIGGR
jgi:diguanylate cyclase (GGDEF)-like protein/PAS domain S-box-containing protein